MRKQIESILRKQNNLTATYFKSPLENILPSIHSNWEKIEADLSQGSGNELQSGKFHSIASLGVNEFGVFYEPNFMIWPTIESEKFTIQYLRKNCQMDLEAPTRIWMSFL